MTDSSDPALKFVPPLKDLAEGRYAPEAWVAWWNQHAAELQAALLPGWFIRLKPRFEGTSLNGTVEGCQDGACYVLDALKVPYDHSSRYHDAWELEYRRSCEESKAKQKALAKRYAPMIRAVEKNFPKFARFLKRRVEDIDSMAEPASETDLAGFEKTLSLKLPATYRTFLHCTRSIELEGLKFGIEHPFVHEAKPGVILPTEGMLCIADYWLEADGDQVLFDLKGHAGDDPPVFYYAHGQAPPRVRPLAPTFTGWLEGLPRSPLFRE
jgi:hypothetical protein